MLNILEEFKYKNIYFCIVPLLLELYPLASIEYYPIIIPIRWCCAVVQVKIKIY